MFSFYLNLYSPFYKDWYSLINRYWSLKSATSNIKKNFIVTGVRFVKKLRVIHVEVEQAKALSEGKFYRGIVSNDN